MAENIDEEEEDDGLDSFLDDGVLEELDNGKDEDGESD